MSEADKAFKAALEIIAQVKTAGGAEVSLAGDEFNALDRVPPELAALTSLQELYLNNTQVSDLAPLQALTSLQSLDINYTQVSDLAPLQALTSLNALYLNNTQVSDLAPLQALTSLRRLDLNYTQVSDLAPLQALTSLQSLDINYTQVSDLAPLQALTSLQRLYLNYTQVSDLAPLQALTSLQWLDLNNTQVSDLAPLKALTSLRLLDLNYTQVSDLAPLQALTSLNALYLDSTQVSDLAPLKALTGLYRLYLDSTQVSDLAPLKALTSLQWLDLNNTLVSDLAPLKALTSPQWLDLTGTQVSDLTPLQALTSLQSLRLDGTQVRDLRPIAELEQLKSNSQAAGLSCDDTPATERDARLAELARIDNAQDRTVKILDYLLSLPPWPDAYTPEAAPVDGAPSPNGDIPPPPKQDPALPLVWGAHGFSFLANSINSDPVTEAALDDLRDLLDDLRRKGNQHDDLYRIAGELQDRCAGEVSDLNMVKLHLSYQKLRRLHMGRASRENQFDDETVYSMEAVFDVLPGVTLADDNVRVLIERQETERAAGLLPAQDAAATDLLKDVQEPDAPFAPEVKDTAAEVLRPNIEDRLSGTRGILSSSVVVAALLYVGKPIVEGAIGGPVGNFVYDNGSDLLAYAATMGDDALVWAQSIMAKFRVEYEISMGIVREVTGESAHRKPPAPGRGEVSNK